MQSAFSQNNYLPAYIINNKGDSISGFIDYREWNTNPNKISFKTNKQEKALVYKPMDIQKFAVADDHYVSATVLTEVSSVSTNTLKEDPKLKLVEKTVFLQILIDGQKNLYFYKDQIGHDNFYFKEGSKFELLIYKKYIKTRDNKNVIAENNKFRGQLSVYLGDCDKISTYVGKTKYNEFSLKELYNHYFTCMNSDINFKKEEDNDWMSFGIIAAVSQTTVDFVGSHYSHLDGIAFPNSVNIAAGGFFELTFRRSLRKWSFNNELLYTAFSTENETHDRYRDEYVKLGFSYIKLNNMFRYRMPVKKAFVMFDFGLSTGFLISQTNEKYTELHFSNTTKQEKAIDDVRNIETGLLLGLGGGYKKFSLEFRYEIGNGISPYLDLSSKVKRFYALLAYHF